MAAVPGFEAPKQLPAEEIVGKKPAGSVGIVRFLWTLTLFLIIVALLPGRVGLAVGALVALGAVLFAPALPEFIETVVRGG